MGIYIDGPETFSDIKSILRRRGHLPIRQGASTDTLFPEEKIGKMIEELGKEEYRRRFPTNIRDSYYELFGRASFRKMVRRLLRDDRQWTPSTDLVGIAGSAAPGYLNYLENLQVLERNGDRVRVSRPISNIGPSLEHYVAQVCIRELRGSAEWGVVLEELPRSGGDYDVLAWLEPSLIYIECKSGQVANISKGELREFFQRTVELAPDLAIFLVDTEDDLAPLVSSKMNPILSDAVPGVLGTYKPIRPLTDYPRVSYGFDRIYVTNSKKTILAQIRRCLQHYYAHVKGGSDWLEGAVNFIGVPVRDQG